MADTTRLVHAYTQYRIENEKLKARFRKERNKELRPLLVELGSAITELQESGMNITEISRLTGLKNRNFFYDAKRAFAGLKPKPSQPEKAVPVEADTELNVHWRELIPGLYEVTIDDSTYTVEYVDGDIVMPDEWLDFTEPEQKKAIRQVVNELNEVMENHAAA